jgi:hypothetical protein
LFSSGALLPGEDKQTVMKGYKQSVSSKFAKFEVEVSEDLEYLKSKLTEAKQILRKVERDLQDAHRLAHRTESFEEWFATMKARFDNLCEEAIQERIQADKTCKGNSTSAFLRGGFDDFVTYLAIIYKLNEILKFIPASNPEPLTRDVLLDDIDSGKRKSVRMTDEYTPGINSKTRILFMRLRHANEDVDHYASKVDQLTEDSAHWTRQNMEIKRAIFADISRNLS